MKIGDIELGIKEYVFIGLFFIFIYSLITSPSTSGLVLITAFIIFGISAMYEKSHQYKIILLLAIVGLSLLNIFVNGLKFGIDFKGGTRIPIVLERSVDQKTMQEMLNVIKKRASVLGLTEVKVKAIGSTQINIELPSSDEEYIKKVEEVLASQGVFMGIVDGKIAITGRDILPGTIKKYYGLPNADWAVTFSVNKEGAERFANVSKGKGGYPLYLFIDRPTHTDIFINKKYLKHEVFEEDEIIEALKDAIRLEGDDSNIYVIGSIDWNKINGTNRTAIIEDKELEQKLKSYGYKVKIKQLNFTITNLDGEPVVDEWEAIGLLSAPRLSEGVTQGIPLYNYQISGAAKGTGKEKYENAVEQAKKVESILKGGALPVRISIGSRISIPATLGESFLNISIIGILSALIFVSVVVAIRYRKIKLIIPAVIVSVSEFIIILAILGSFTIDLAGMAGIIAAIGVGVDAQIVITDELLKKGGSADEKFKKAYEIIGTNVIVAILTMIPLLFSGLVEVIGFAVSTIMGALLGYLISRPAYAVMVEEILGIE